jgi:PAS domain S-box-containing protein
MYEVSVMLDKNFDRPLHQTLMAYSDVHSAQSNDFSENMLLEMLAPQQAFSQSYRVSDKLKQLIRLFETEDTLSLMRLNALCITDASQTDNPIIYVNQGFTEMTGYTLKDVYGRNCRFLQANDRDQPGRFELKEALREGREIRIELRNYRKDGQLFWNELYMVPIRDKNSPIIGFLGIQHDITLKKELEIELERRNQELSELDRLKGDFINAASHEFRTPLTAIKGFIELLEDDQDAALTTKQLEYVKHINHGIERLQDHLDELLDFAKMEAGTFYLEAGVHIVNHIVSTELDLLASLALKKNMALIYSEQNRNIFATVDAKRIAQITTNLITNAINYTPEGGNIWVNLTQNDTHFTLEVKDNGPGIHPLDQDKVFDKFFRVTQDPKSKVNGTGLGLSITKGLVEAHNGTIALESSRGKGSRFTVSIPL